MHDHHSVGGLNLLPLPIALAWLLVLALASAHHGTHLLVTRGQARAWHATHLAMGVGMLAMFAPWAGGLGGARAWQYLYAALAVGVLGWIAARLQRGERIGLIWLPAGIGMAAMAYMFVVHGGSGTRAVTYLLVVYYLLEAAAWAQGAFAEDGRRAALLPVALGRDARSCADSGRIPCSLRWCQTASALAMGYMFLAMDPAASSFFERAFGAGTVTEESLWAVALVAIVVLACVPQRAPARVSVPA